MTTSTWNLQGYGLEVTTKAAFERPAAVRRAGSVLGSSIGQLHIARALHAGCWSREEPDVHPQLASAARLPLWTSDCC